MSIKYNKQNLKIMIIGPTGAGKTSLINLFHVWSLDLPFSELSKLKKVAIATKYLEGDGSVQNQKKNQKQTGTLWPKIYNVKVKDKIRLVQYDLTCLDTPGLGDVRGVKQDDENIELIFNQITKTQDLNALLLVMNGTDGRMHQRVKYIFSKLQILLPTSFKENLFLLYTNVTGKTALSLEKDIDINQSRVLSYQNLIFTYEPHQLESQPLVELFYPKSLNILSNMLDQMSKCRFKSTKYFEDIKKERQSLQILLNQFNQTSIQTSIQKKRLIKFEKDIMQANKDLVELNKKLTEKEKKYIWKAYPTPHYNTVCDTCQNCCHYGCGIQLINTMGSSKIQSCTAFNGSNSCKTCNHSYLSHHHVYQIRKQEIVEVFKINLQVQDQTYSKNNYISSTKDLQNKIEKKIKEIENKQKEITNQIIKIIQKIQALCSSFDYIKQLQATSNVLTEKIMVLNAEYCSNKEEEIRLRVIQTENLKERMGHLIELIGKKK